MAKARGQQSSTRFQQPNQIKPYWSPPAAPRAPEVYLDVTYIHVSEQLTAVRWPNLADSSVLICYFVVGSVVGRKYIIILYCFKTIT